MRFYVALSIVRLLTPEFRYAPLEIVRDIPYFESPREEFRAAMRRDRRGICKRIEFSDPEYSRARAFLRAAVGFPPTSARLR